MKTLSIKKEIHIPNCFIIDATKKTLGRLASEASRLLAGSNTYRYRQGSDQGNFVIIINAEKIAISGNKFYNKIYFNSSQRPGGLKSLTFAELQKKMPYMPLQKAILGMLPKNKLKKQYAKRLFIYSSNIQNSVESLPLPKIKATWIF